MAFVIPAVVAGISALGSAGAATAAGGAVAGAATAAASTAPWLAYAGLGAGLLGAGASAFGAYEQGQAEKGAAKYNAAMASQNAKVAQENATIASQSGQAQAGIAEQKARAEVGALKANEAAAGIDVSSGSAVDVRSSAASLGELDALTVRSNATREAYGYQTQSESFKAQSGLDKFEAENAQTAGMIGAGSTLLGGVGSAAENFAKWQTQYGFGS